MHHDEPSELTQVGFQAERDLLEDFDRVAKKNRRSRSGELRHIMQRHVNANRPRTEPQEAEAA